MKVELSHDEIVIIIQAISASWFPPDKEKKAYELVKRLKTSAEP